MTLTNAFKEAVSSNNVRRVRIMMKDSLLNDPTFSEFNEMISTAGDLSGLFDKHDGRDLNNDKNMWNDSYMNELMVQIVGNFSHERIDHLKDVVRQLRPIAKHSKESQQNGRSITEPEKPSRQTFTVSTDNQEQEYHNQRNSLNRKTKIAGGAIIGAVAGGAVAAVASVSVIGGIAIGTVAGAVVVTVMTSGE